jgi:hypothetical protein
MIRGFAMAALLVVAGSVPALAQTSRHGPGHVRPDSSKHHPHGPGHARPDSATHAAIHAMLHGSWAGTLTSPHGVSSAMSLSVSRDSVRGIALTLSTVEPKRAGAARDMVMVGDTLRWTQDLAGVPCKASALLTSAKAAAPRALNGKLACDNVESTFTLKKAE